MSIIYDALKKSGDNPDKERKTALSPDAAPIPAVMPKKAFDKKKLFIPVVFLAIVGFFAYQLVFAKKVPDKHSRSKHSSASKNFSGTKHESSRPAPAPVVKNYFSLTLEGIIFDETKPIAIINGKVVKPGDTIDDTTVEKITPTKVILHKNGTTQELSM
jgi:hypothetical protein